MNDLQDAYGHALRDYLRRRGKSREVIERDDGYVDVPLLGRELYFADYTRWPVHHKRAMRYARGRVLDVGCGGGRHALYLQKKGLEVLGIDASPLAVVVCRRRGVKWVRVMPITRINSALGTFRTVLMLGNNFGLLANRVRGRWWLRRLHSITDPDARIIAESVDPYLTDNPLHLAYHKRNRQRGRMAGQLRIRVRYQKYATPWFDYLFVSRTEMVAMLRGTGWAVERFLVGGPNYIAVIAKKH